MFGSSFQIPYEHFFVPTIPIQSTITNVVNASISNSITQSVTNNITANALPTLLPQHMCSLVQTSNIREFHISNIIDPKPSPAPYTYQIHKGDPQGLSTLKATYNNLAADIFDGSGGITIHPFIQHETLKSLQKGIEKHCMP